MNRSALVCGWILSLSATITIADDPECIDVEIDPGYRAAIVANEFLMQEGGVDAVTLPGDVDVLIGVGQVAVKAGSTPADLLKARRAAESKATRSVGEYLRADVSAVRILVKRKLEQSMKDDDARAEITRRIEKYITTHIDVRSDLVARIRRVGHWKNADGTYLYVAVAVTPLE